MSIARFVTYVLMFVGACCAVVATAAAAAPPATAEARPLVTWVDLPNAIASCAVAPGRGMVAVVEAGEGGAAGTVIGYPDLGKGATAGAIRRVVGARPLAVRHKAVGAAGYFLVPCAGDQALWVLDDRTLEVVKTIPLPGPVVRVAAPSRADVPHAYYLVSHGNQHSLGRIDLARMIDEGAILGLNWSADTIAVSADGEFLYAAQATLRAGPRLRGVTVCQLPATAGAGSRLTPVASTQDEYAGFQPDPLGQFVAAGATLMTPEWKPLGKNLPATPVAFVTNRPLIAGWDGTSVHLISANTLAPLARVEVRFDDGAGRAPVAAEVAVRADGRNDALLFFRGTRVAVVSLAAVDMPREPDLSVAVEGPTTLSAESSADLKVTPRHAGARVDLASGPAGMTLRDGRLTWRPGPADVGTFNAVLHVAAGGIERRHELRLVVRRPGLTLPFPVQEAALSADGATLAVLARPSYPVFNRAAGAGRQPLPPSRIAVVDVRTMKVIADRELTTPVRGLAVDGRHVYAAAQDADAFYVFARADLAEVKRVFTSTRVIALAPLAGKRLFVTLNGSVPTDYSLPALEPLDGGPESGRPVRRAINGGGVRSTPVPLGDDGWYFRGAVFGRDWGTATLLLRTVEVPLATGATPADPMYRPELSRDPPFAPWATTITEGAIKRTSGQSVGRLPGIAQALLPDVPAAAALVLGADDVPRDGSVERWELVFTDLLTAKVVDRFVLLNEARPGGGTIDTQQRWVLTAPGVVVAVANGRAFAVPTKALSAAAYPTPLHFKPHQSTMLIAPDRPAQLACKVAGGKAPVDFRLAGDAPGILIDPRTGVVTIDTPKLVERAAEAAAIVLTRRVIGGPSPGGAAEPPTLGARVEELAQSAAAAVRELTGAEPRGLPVAVPVGIVARDAEQQTATLTPLVLVDVPLATVEAAARRRAEQTRASDQAGANSADVARLQRRVAELERENQDLQAQNRLLRELVGGRTPQTRPAAP